MNISIVIPVLVGLASGMLVNYLSDVLPLTRKFSPPACLQCGGIFRATDYLSLRPCPQCGQRRSRRNWLTLLILVGANLYAWFFPPERLEYAFSALTLAYFALIAVIDIEHRLILRPTSAFGAVLGFSLGWRQHGLIQALLGGLIGYTIMYAIYYAGTLFARYRARRMAAAGQAADDEEALGFGDVNLAGVLGLLTGWGNIVVVLLQGILFAGIFGVLMVAFMLFARKYKENALMVFMPYGPFLILSAFLNVFIPDWLGYIIK